MTVVDSTFLIDLMRGDPGAYTFLQGWEAEGWPVHAPTVAVYELHRGLARSDRPTLELERIRQVLSTLSLLPMDAEAAKIGGQIEGALKEAGTPIGVEDCMIAGIALRHGHAVLTRNTKDFGRIQGLDILEY